MPRLSVTVGGLVLPYCLVCRMPSGPVEMYSTGSTSVLIPESSLKDANWMPSTWMTKVDADITVGLPPATGAMAKCSFLFQFCSAVAGDDPVARDHDVFGHEALTGLRSGDVDLRAPGVLQRVGE